MRSTRVIVRWPEGLHARTAASLVRLTQKFRSRIRLRLGPRLADARSILNILILSASLGAAIDIDAEGVDEHEAIRAVEDFFGEQQAGADSEAASADRRPRR